MGPLHELSLASLSDVEVRLFADHPNRPEVLVIQYRGVYRRGSEGNPDAQYMRAMAVAANAAYEPRALIHDFSQLDYRWGDMLDSVYAVGAEVTAIVVGPACEEAIRTLMFGTRSARRLDEREDVFRSLEQALGYVRESSPR